MNVQQPEGLANIEALFELIDQSTLLLAQAKGNNYLEALIDSAEQLFQKEIFISLSPDEESQLKKLYCSYEEQAYTKEERRRAFQLAVLKGMKDLSIPVGSVVTPDAVVMFIAYLAKKLVKPAVVLDPAVGTGNLLTGVLNQYTHSLTSFATEVDSTLVRLAYVNANLQQHSLDIYHQDGLKDLYIPPVDLIVCDLPVGIYPNQKVAKAYRLYEPENEPYTHQLLMEKAIELTKAGGYLIFLIPNSLFVEPGSQKLRTLLTETTYIQALLQLPDSLFQDGSVHKSIFILQKKGEPMSRRRETLIAQMPSFTDVQAFTRMLQKVEDWIRTE